MRKRALRKVLPKAERKDLKIQVYPEDGLVFINLIPVGTGGARQSLTLDLTPEHAEAFANLILQKAKVARGTGEDEEE